MVKAAKITVRQPGTGKSLYYDPNVGWRWCGASGLGHGTPVGHWGVILFATELALHVVRSHCAALASFALPP